MAKKKKIQKISDIKTLDKWFEFRSQVFFPMKPGKEKDDLRVELRKKRREIRESTRENKG